MRLAIAIAVSGMLFFLLMYSLKRRESKHSTIVRRMEFFSGNADAAVGGVPIDKDEGLKEKAMSKIRAMATHWQKVHQNDNLDLLMQKADWPLLGSEFQIILILASIAVGIFAVLLTFNPVMFILGAGGAALFGLMYLKLHIANRQRAFLNQLGDTLIMVSNALRAGFSFMQAMELISKEMSAPIGTEFQKVINEINLGATLETALENMGRRMTSPDFELVVTAVLIQRQVGGNLSQVLDTISYTINERIRMRREISALTAQGKLSGIIVGVIPFFIAGFILVKNPDYFQPMLDSPIGRMLLVGAVISELIAVFIIRKIIDIDV